MELIKTKPKYKNILIVYAVIFLMVLIFPTSNKNQYMLWGTIFIIYIVVFMSIDVLLINDQRIKFNYPFIPFYDPKPILLKEIKRIKVHFTESLIDAGLPNSILIELKNGKKMTKYISINKDEYHVLESITERNKIQLDRKGIIK